MLPTCAGHRESLFAVGYFLILINGLESPDKKLHQNGTDRLTGTFDYTQRFGYWVWLHGTTGLTVAC